MNKQQKLKQAVRKLIKPVCEDCWGWGVLPKENKIQQLRLECKTCNGKGYIDNTFSKPSSYNDWEGEGLYLQEILLALSKIGINYESYGLGILVTRQFNQYDLLNQIAAYTDSHYTSGQFDDLGRRKPFHNISNRILHMESEKEWI